jgi:hypothetical protein
MANLNEISDFIWRIKELLRDDYKSKPYAELIERLTELNRRFTVLDIEK